MNDKHIQHLEQRLERLVEGVFASLFRKAISAHDVAVAVGRAMNAHLAPAEGDDPRPIAPDRYRIALNDGVHAHLLRTRPNFVPALTEYISELVAQSGYRLRHAPTATLLADASLSADALSVEATHDPADMGGTAAMHAVRLPDNPPAPACYLVIGERHIPLTQAVLNIGRSDDNHIMLDDRYVSRHHAQLRLRFGAYTLFDAQSQSGTYVNNVRLNEHRLQSGDVIRLGRTQMMFVIDNGKGNAPPLGTTGIMPPVGE